MQKALREGDPEQVAQWAKALLKGENITVSVDSKTYEITPEGCEVQQSAAEGYAVAEEYGYLAALSTRLTDDLVREGLAREFVRRIQTLRKDADFDISDHIAVTYRAGGKITEAIRAFADYIQRETLADELVEGEAANGAEFNFDGETVTVSVRQIERTV